jgi:sulfoxide reductase heme-binding subunit YedZ
VIPKRIPGESVGSAAAAPRAHGKRRTASLVCLALGLAPLAKLLVDGLSGHLGANPIAEVLNRLGFWTLTFVALSLAPTPARELLGLTWPVRLRRILGLLAFAYGALHFAWYVGVDQFFWVPGIAKDIGKRKFITVGFAALVLLAPLAVTSTNGWVRRLGYTRWKRLHRLAYVAALLGVVHFVWRVKADHRKPAAFAIVIGALLAARVFTRLRSLSSARGRTGSTRT